MKNETELERLNREFKRDTRIAKTILTGTVLGCLSYAIVTVILGAPDDFLRLVVSVGVTTATTHFLGTFK